MIRIKVRGLRKPDGVQNFRIPIVLCGVTRKDIVLSGAHRGHTQETIQDVHPKLKQWLRIFRIRSRATGLLRLTPGSPTPTRPATVSRTIWTSTGATRPFQPKTRMCLPVTGTRGFTRVSAP